MEAVNTFKALAVIFVIAVFSTAVSAQDLGMAPAPAPGMDNGSAYSLPISGAAVCAALFLSLLALMKN